MIDRRTFVNAVGAAGLAALGVTRPARAYKLDRIGIQLYTVRDAMALDVNRTLERVAQIGFRDVEFAGYFGRTPAQIRLAVERLGLRAPGTHLEYERLESDWRRTLDAAAAAGHQYVVIPWVPEPARRTEDDWRRLADLLNRCGHAARSAGVRLAYHNQLYDVQPINDVMPIDRLARDTDPEAVTFELDVFWAVKGGADPFLLLDRHVGRFTLIHAKDIGRAPALEMKDVGAGTMDWRALLAAARPVHVFVEHDEPPDALASVRASYRFLRRLEF